MTEILPGYDAWKLQGPPEPVDDGDLCPQCGDREYQADGNGCGELVECDNCRRKACVTCLQANDGRCLKCAIDPDDLPDEAYDPNDFRDIGGIGVEPK